MKNLTGIFLGLCMMCLFSVQAGAEDSNAVEMQKPQPAPSAQPVPQVQSNNNQVAQGAAPQIGQANSPDSQNIQQWGAGNGTVQELQQFDQQTQDEMNSFKKLSQ